MRCGPVARANQPAKTFQCSPTPSKRAHVSLRPAGSLERVNHSRRANNYRAGPLVKAKNHQRSVRNRGRRASKTRPHVGAISSWSNPTAQIQPFLLDLQANHLSAAVACEGQSCQFHPFPRHILQCIVEVNCLQRRTKITKRTAKG